MTAAGASGARRPLIGASWKMNLTSSEAEGWLRTAVPLLAGLDDRDLFVLPSFPVIWMARRELEATGIAWGAQDLHPEDLGAHTGDVSAAMLADLGCTYVEVGHSERRREHHENDTLIAAKIRAALRWDLTPIICVGELELHGVPAASGEVTRHLAASLGELPGADLGRVVVAYEPQWAIGTGAQAAPLDHIAAMHAVIRSWLHTNGATATRIVYGGSIDAAGARGILATPGVDGLFVGRAALDPVVFAGIAASPVPARETVT
jgi:triosephosphate isomerase (TIM)